MSQMRYELMCVDRQPLLRGVPRGGDYVGLEGPEVVWVQTKMHVAT